MSSDTLGGIFELLPLTYFAGVSMYLLWCINHHFSAVDKRRAEFHKTLDAWQSSRLVDAAEREDGE